MTAEEFVEAVRLLAAGTGCQEWCEGFSDSDSGFPKLPKCDLCKLRELIRGLPTS